MNAEVKLTGVNYEELRDLMAHCSKVRDAVLLDGTCHPARWAPRVHCEGPDGFTVYLPKLPVGVAGNILLTHY